MSWAKIDDVTRAMELPNGVIVEKSRPEFGTMSLVFVSGVRIEARGGVATIVMPSRDEHTTNQTWAGYTR